MAEMPLEPICLGTCGPEAADELHVAHSGNIHGRIG